MIDLDAILTAAAAGTDINLEANGLYYTRGYRDDASPQTNKLRSGCHLNGKGATVKVLTDQTASSVSGLYCDGSNVITNLTVEIASQSIDSGRKINGIWIEGGVGNLVSKCTVLGQSGNKAAGRESFGIRVGGVRNTVQRCLVAENNGDYCTAIQCASGNVDTCKVVWEDPTPAGANLFSYNIGYLTGSTIRYCESYGGTNAVRCEAWLPTSERSVIEHCKFHRTDLGLYILAQQSAHILVPWYARDITFMNNKVTLNHDSPNTIAGFILDHTWAVFSEDPTTINGIRGIAIEGNDFAFDEIAPARTNVRVANIATNCLNSTPDVGIYDVKILKNTYHPAMSWRNKGMRAKFIQVDETVTWVTT